MSGGMDRDPMDARDTESPIEAAARRVREAAAGVREATKALKDAEAALLALAKGA